MPERSRLLGQALAELARRRGLAELETGRRRAAEADRLLRGMLAELAPVRSVSSSSLTR